eukprot:TRINITY_DN76036_c0_g1_i1.p1 TRINITY_DN76036_c0_g1~~TRINITY_DN76036_c0_g1_i1.p1  ORF type:complete len:288 (+),score=16.48 TRINITY_DN76036_c0_g1_i1:198-1061(+)
MPAVTPSFVRRNDVLADMRRRVEENVQSQKPKATRPRTGALMQKECNVLSSTRLVDHQHRQLEHAPQQKSVERLTIPSMRSQRFRDVLPTKIVTRRKHGFLNWSRRRFLDRHGHSRTNRMIVPALAICGRRYRPPRKHQTYRGVKDSGNVNTSLNTRSLASRTVEGGFRSTSGCGVYRPVLMEDSTGSAWYRFILVTWCIAVACNYLPLLGGHLRAGIQCSGLRHNTGPDMLERKFKLQSGAGAADEEFPFWQGFYITISSASRIRLRRQQRRRGGKMDGRCQPGDR